MAQLDTVRIAATIPPGLHLALVRRAGELERSQAWVLRDALRCYLYSVEREAGTGGTE